MHTRSFLCNISLLSVNVSFQLKYKTFSFFLSFFLSKKYEATMLCVTFCSSSSYYAKKRIYIRIFCMSSTGKIEK